MEVLARDGALMDFELHHDIKKRMDGIFLIIFFSKHGEKTKRQKEQDFLPR